MHEDTTENYVFDTQMTILMYKSERPFACALVKLMLQTEPM